MKNELTELRAAVEKLDEEYDRRMQILNKDYIELPNGCILKSIHDRLSYVDQANKMMENAEGSKEKVSYLQKEISHLDDTIAAIIQRKSKKHYMLSKKEENVGATGYYHIQSNLQATNKRVEKMNELKENAMKEISRSVIEMKNILSSQQAKLQPMVRVDFLKTPISNINII
jgi:phosphosulfolactate synthase (CoM biosynthesis protein A)